MAKKKQSQGKGIRSDNFLRIYLTTLGGYLAGEERGRSDSMIELRDPVFVTTRADGTGYDTKPVQFVPPEKTLNLYRTGLVADFAMPDGMIPWFRKYQEDRVEQARKTP